MPNNSCPQCHSPLDDDLIESTGRAECPFCGAEIDTPLLSPVDRSDGEENIMLPPVPPKSILQVIEATPQRRVFYIPGGRAAGIGCFALLWNGFMTFFTAGFMSSMINQGEGWGTILGLTAFLSLFWMIGLGMAVWWVKAKFERLFLLLQPQQLVIQRVLFGRKRLKTFQLSPASRAELTEAYQQNDNPVYRIEVEGTDGTAKFGTALQRDEKNWLVDRINEFLRPLPDKDAPAEPPKFCHQCGAKLDDIDPDADEIICHACGHTIPTAIADPRGTDAVEETIDDENLPQPPELQIEEQTVDHLRFTLPSCTNPMIGWGILLFTLLSGGVFSVIALSSLFDFGDFDLLHTLFLLPFLLGGLVPISIGLFFVRGRITVDITPEELQTRYHLGLLRYTKSVPTQSISRVKMMEAEEADSRIRSSNRPRKKGNISAAVVQSGTTTIPLTLIHEKETARYVTQLVRRQLRGMGVTLS